jgi:glucose/arabinose dehydrogenase
VTRLAFLSWFRRAGLAAALAVALQLPTLGGEPADAAPLPGFQETTAFSGLSNPTALEFSPDGRVFVGEKSGLIKVFDGLGDTSPVTFKDLRTEVHNFWDRGLLGMALDPDFPSDPYVYVLYTRDAMPGGAAPHWGQPGVSSDPCPTPPGATGDGCVVTGRLTRLTATGNVATAEAPLITDWCQQYPSHSTGSLAFGADGALYASAGDGASFNFPDYGQDGNPLNPCGDPPGGVGAALTPPTAEGGALRSQDVRTTGDPTGLDGTVIRVDPATGEGLPGNPFFASSDANSRRIVSLGQRNPFRMTIRPGTNEVWSGDVGWGTWEEINRSVDPAGGAENFGWPCYEGNNSGSARQGSYDGANLNLCESLYTPGDGNVVPPYFAYNHSATVVAGESCPTGSSSISGLDFYVSGGFPNEYNGALFFSDYSRDCIWAMMPGGPSGLPNKTTIRTFNAGAANPVDLEISPQGDLFYADLDGGTIRRISHTTGNAAPTAIATAIPSSGSAPLQVQLSAAQSSDPNGDALTYAWDLDGDGQYDDSTAVTLTRTYSDPGTHTAAVRVTDPDGASDTDDVPIQVGNDPPEAEITAPGADLLWAVNDEIDYSGTATDPQQGSLPESAYAWTITLNHCPSNCHEHVIEEPLGSADGTFIAPDHEYPSSLTLRLEVTDEHGLTDSDEVTVDPSTVEVSLRSEPAGMELTLDGQTGVAPFTSTAIEGSQHTVVAPPEQTVGGQQLHFQSWSDGGAATHTVVAGSDLNLVARYGTDPLLPDLPEVLGVVRHGCGGQVATVVGTKRADVLRGTQGPDVIVALGGRDEVRARGGADLVCGAGGPDRLDGGGGKDRLYGGDGRDRLAGGRGTDLCSGGPSADRGTACERSKSLLP